MKYKKYKAMIYYPVPSSDAAYLNKKSDIDVMSVFIPDITYGDSLRLECDENKLIFS
jgi:hypothetical protein